MNLANFKGCILGLAVGDALGAPSEFLSMAEIRARWGRLATFEPWPHHRAGDWTDDTEMTLVVSEALTSAEATSQEAVIESIAVGFARWYDIHDPTRAPGNSCLAGAKNLNRSLRSTRPGVPTTLRKTKSGVRSRGCGAIMRVAPVGLLYHNDDHDLPEKSTKDFRACVATAQALATHDSWPAADAAAALAALVANATSPLPEAIQTARNQVSNDEVQWILATAERWFQQGRSSEFVLDQWRGWDSLTALGASLFLALKHQDDYREGVIDAVNSPGDSDSLGCITGAILGARLGIDAIPKQWVGLVEACGALNGEAERLWSKSVKLNAISY